MGPSKLVERWRYVYCCKMVLGVNVLCNGETSKNVLRLLGYYETLRFKEHGESEKFAIIFSATTAIAATLRLVTLS